MAKSLIDLQNKVAKFRDDRDWKQFHAPKDLAASISIEAAELLECFQWKSKKEVELMLDSEKRDKVSEEMADILIYLLNLADTTGVDVLKEAYKKLAKNAGKYPVAKAKGTHKKYTELEKS